MLLNCLPGLLRGRDDAGQLLADEHAGVGGRQDLGHCLAANQLRLLGLGRRRLGHGLGLGIIQNSLQGGTVTWVGLTFT